MKLLPRLRLNENIGAGVQLKWIDRLSEVRHIQDCDFNREKSRKCCVDETVQVIEKSTGKAV